MRYPKFAAVFLVAALFAGLSGCSSSPSSSKSEDPNDTKSLAQSSDQQVPFDKSSKGAQNEKNDSNEKKGGLLSSLVSSPVTVPAGSVIAIRLQSGVSSTTAQSGDSFDAVLDEPLIVGGKTVAEKGAAVTGRVMEAKASGRLHDSGYIRLTVTSIEMNGKSVPVHTSSLFAKGANHNKRNTALIGGGAGLGALVGGLAGGGKGALIGAAAGGGAGTAGAYATGKKDVGFAAERRLNFRLTEAVQTKV